MSKIKLFFKRLFCKHNPYHVWQVFPTQVWVNDNKAHGLKLYICMDCQRIIIFEDYAK